MVELQAMPDAGVDHEGDIALPFVERDRLERELGRLPVEQRAVIVTHFYLGFPISEVAEILGLAVGTAKSRLSRGLQALRIALEGDAENPAHAIPVRTP
jgi:RNA polymerase sigma factor (sigma-70 family)